jgi:hypothetical protein
MVEKLMTSPDPPGDQRGVPLPWLILSLSMSIVLPPVGCLGEAVRPMGRHLVSTKISFLVFLYRDPFSGIFFVFLFYGDGLPSIQTQGGDVGWPSFLQNRPRIDETPFTNT